jgi:hypothetical protein
MTENHSEGGGLVPIEEGLWAALRKFDWLGIPGATRSISRLVGSLGEAGSEWVGIATARAKQIQGKIADDAAAHKAMSSAIAKQAAKTGAADPEIVQLHMEAWAGERVRKQTNKAEVALMTLEELKADPPPDDAVGPDDDWLNVFETHAEKASSERLRHLWAKILAGEIRKVGSFSYKTMEFVSLIDSAVANALQAISKNVLQNEYVLDPDRYNYKLEFTFLSMLQEYGLVTDERSRRISLNDKGAILILAGNDLGIILNGLPNATINTQVYLLTRVGSEIVKIIDKKHTVDTVAEEASRFAGYGEITRVMVCSTRDLGGGLVGGKDVLRIVKEPPAGAASS